MLTCYLHCLMGLFFIGEQVALHLSPGNLDCMLMEIWLIPQINYACANLQRLNNRWQCMVYGYTAIFVQWSETLCDVVRRCLLFIFLFPQPAFQQTTSSPWKPTFLSISEQRCHGEPCDLSLLVN